MTNGLRLDLLVWFYTAQRCCCVSVPFVLFVFLLHEILLCVSTVVQHFVHIMCCSLTLTCYTLLWLSRHTRHLQKEKKNNKIPQLATLPFSTVSLFITQTQAYVEAL